jgi:hypothetical protein
VTALEPMSTEAKPQSHLPSLGGTAQPPARKGTWVRAVVYLVLAGALGLAVWRIYQNQQQSKQDSARQAAE